MRTLTLSFPVLHPNCKTSSIASLTVFLIDFVNTASVASSYAFSYHLDHSLSPDKGIHRDCQLSPWAQHIAWQGHPSGLGLIRLSQIVFTLSAFRTSTAALCNFVNLSSSVTEARCPVLPVWKDESCVSMPQVFCFTSSVAFIVIEFDRAEWFFYTFLQDGGWRYQLLVFCIRSLDTSVIPLTEYRPQKL